MKIRLNVILSVFIVFVFVFTGCKNRAPKSKIKGEVVRGANAYYVIEAWNKMSDPDRRKVVTQTVYLLEQGLDKYYGEKRKLEIKNVADMLLTEDPDAQKEGSLEWILNVSKKFYEENPAIMDKLGFSLHYSDFFPTALTLSVGAGAGFILGASANIGIIAVPIKVTTVPFFQGPGETETKESILQRAEQYLDNAKFRYTISLFTYPSFNIGKLGVGGGPALGFLWGRLDDARNYWGTFVGANFGFTAGVGVKVKVGALRRTLSKTGQIEGICSYLNSGEYDKVKMTDEVKKWNDEHVNDYVHNIMIMLQGSFGGDVSPVYANVSYVCPLNIAWLNRELGIAKTFAEQIGIDGVTEIKQTQADKEKATTVQKDVATDQTATGTATSVVGATPPPPTPTAYNEDGYNDNIVVNALWLTGGGQENAPANIEFAPSEIILEVDADEDLGQ